MAVTAGAGILVAIARASDDAWRTGPISLLTRDPTGGLAFRVGIVSAGLVGLWTARSWAGLLAELHRAGLMTDRWRRAWAAGGYLAGLALILAGAVPLGVSGWFEIVHGTGAYVVPIVLLAAMLTARLAVPAIGDGLGRLSLAILAAVLISYLLAVAAVVQYWVMEVFAFGVAGGWLYLLTGRLGTLPGVSGDVRP